MLPVKPDTEEFLVLLLALLASVAGLLSTLQNGSPGGWIVAVATAILAHHYLRKWRKALGK